MERFRGKGRTCLSSVCCLAGSFLATCEGKLLQKPSRAELLIDGQIRDNQSKNNNTAVDRQQENRSSLMSFSGTELDLAHQDQARVREALNKKDFPADAKAYTFKDLKDKFGFSDEDVREYFSRDEQAMTPVRSSVSATSESLQATPASHTNGRIYTYSELRNDLGFSNNQILDYFSKVAPAAIPPFVLASPEDGKTYTPAEMRGDFGFTDQNILDYYSKQNPASRVSQENVNSNVMLAPPVERTYSYSELRNELGFNDEQVLEYYMKHDPSMHMQQDASSLSGAGDFSGIPTPPPPSRTYTYSELHDELGLSDEQILNYYSTHDLRSAGSSVSGSVPSSSQSVARTYTYGELRNDLGFSDDQILEYYLKNDPAKRMSARAADDRVYTYSELRDDLGFSDEQILDYYRSRDPAKQQGSGLVADAVANRSALSPMAAANATANSSAWSEIVDRAYTYSELRDQFGLSDDQIIEYYSEVDNLKHPTLPTAGIQNATTNSTTSHTRIGKTYTYSELRDVLGFSDAQIANYYSNTDEAKQAARDIETFGAGSASTPLENRSYTYAELRDDLGFTDDQILEYYMKLDPASGDSASASASSHVDRVYTYSELRDELGLSDAQILEYYSRSGAKLSAASNVSSPDVTANSSTPLLVGKYFTYTELRDEFGLSDDQIIDYFKQVEENNSAESSGNNGTESELSPGRQSDDEGIRGQQRAGKAYTYSELRDVLGWNDKQIMSYYASVEKASHDASEAGNNTLVPSENPTSTQHLSSRLYTYSELRDTLGFNDQQILSYFAHWDRDRRTQLTPSNLRYLDNSSASAEMVTPSTASDRTYAYAELRDVLGLTNDQILHYYATRESAERSPRLSLLDISKSTFSTANFGSSSSNNSATGDTVQELRANQSSPILGGMYTTPEIRNGFALSDQQVLNYYSSAAPARSDSIPAQKTYSYDQLRHLGLNDQQILDYVRKQQQRAISSSGSVMSAPPPAGETYTYTEPTNQFGPTDEHVLEYSREQQQRATIASGFGNSSVMPSHPAAGNTYTYTELRNQLGLNDEQILEYTRKQQSAISSSDSSVVSAHPAAVKTYTYTELRNKLGLTDEQILDYYTAHYAAERLPQSVGSTNSSTSRVVSSPPLVDRTYTYSELRDGFGFSNDQILDYYSTLARAKQSALSSNTTANATATSSALYAPGRIPQLAGRTYTYSELKDEFGLTDAQIIDYFASAKRGSPGSSVSNISGDPSAVENNSRGNTFDALPSSASKAYTDSELRDVLGYTEGQIPDYYSQKDAELVAPSVSSPIVSAASSLQPASTTRAYTYSDLRNKFGFSDEQILIYYANLKTGSTGISGSSVEASAVDNTNYGTKPMGEDEAKKEPDGRSFTYSEMRDVFRMSDAQILNYYKEQDALGMALPVGEPASVEVNSSAVSGLDSTGMAIGSPVKTDADLDTSLALRLAGKTHTYSELRDKFGLSDAQILEYYSRSIAKHRAGSSISYHGEPIDIPRSVQQPVDRTYTYTELHDMLGMSENQILDYYSKIDGSKRSSLPSIGLAIGNPVS